MLRFPDDRPRLCVVIDTEEEFDWSKPFDRASRSVTNIADQWRAQSIFARYGIIPTYVVDHPVAADETAIGILAECQNAGTAHIGAHLHPWVTPPDEEEICPVNSYPGNLPPDLERQKLTVLTELIAAQTGRRPTVYKAGRYGLGTATPATLSALGYRVDCSVVPFTRFSHDGGPDFTDRDPAPGPLDGQDILELPLSVGFTGLLRRHGRHLFPAVSGGWGLRLHLPGVLARTGVLERIRLSPEGARASDHRRLVNAMRADGHQLFSYTYHSPSLAPGHTPYVETTAVRDRFLDDMDRFFDDFFGRLQGVATTPGDLWEAWRGGAAAPAIDEDRADALAPREG